MGIRGLSCIFPVPDIKKTAEYYVNKLGFRAVEYLDCKEPHICLYREGSTILLLQAYTDRVTPNRTLYGYGYDAYLYADNQEEMEKEYTEKNVKFVRHLNVTDYKNKEFVIEDIDGRWLAIGLKIKDEDYETEAKSKWGDTEAYKEYEEKSKDYSKGQKKDLASNLDHIMGEFAVCMQSGAEPSSDAAQELVKKLQNHISANYYHCTKEILAGLGQMYVLDERFKKNIDKHAEGTAAFICEAIEVYYKD